MDSTLSTYIQGYIEGLVTITTYTAGLPSAKSVLRHWPMPRSHTRLSW